MSLVKAAEHLYFPSAILKSRAAAYQSVQSSDRDRNSEVCAQALLPKLGCFNNDDDEAHLLGSNPKQKVSASSKIR